jgi:hypothetical protein
MSIPAVFCAKTFDDRKIESSGTNERIRVFISAVYLILFLRSVIDSRLMIILFKNSNLSQSR